MPTRQKQLLIVLGLAVLLWQGGGWGWQLVFGPIGKLREDLAKAQVRVDAKTDQAIAIEQAKVKLKNWQARCLSPDPGKKKRPEALEAQRQYNEWLTELAQSIGFEELSVVPQRQSVSPKNVYVEVVVQVDGFGRLSQLYELLDRFYRTDLLHRIGRLQITAEDVVGDPPVKFSLEAGALALTEAPVRRTRFPRTLLAADLEPGDTQLTVTGGAEFPKKPPFRVRLEHELLDVTEVAETVWSVQRGVERTTEVPHAARMLLTLTPVNKTVKEFSSAAFRELVRTNVFVKPSPPVNYEMVFGPFLAAVAIRGKTLELTLAAKDFDPARGDPKYRLTGDVPAGLRIEETTGKLVWRPDAKLPAGSYPLALEVSHPSAPGGTLTAGLDLTLAEPNSVPVFAPVAKQSVYKGQPVHLRIQATDKDASSQTITYKLAAGAPEGCGLDPTTGELTWTPGDEQPVGPVTLAVTATDNGAPPQTATVSVVIDVQEDSANSTFLFGIVALDEEFQALFIDKQQGKTIKLHVGDTLRVADVEAIITAIKADLVTVRYQNAERRMKLGGTVRSLSTSANDKAAAPTQASE